MLQIHYRRKVQGIVDNKYKFQNITDKDIKTKGVQALANRPNAAQQYGLSGLTPEELKKHFDNLAQLLADRLNKLQNAINGKEAVKYIGLDLGDYETLDDLIAAMSSGNFASDVLKLHPNENSLGEVLPLQEIIYDMAQTASELEEKLEDLDEDKLAKVTEPATYKRVYAIDNKGQQVMLDAAASPMSKIPLYSENGALIAKMTPIESMPGVEYPSEVVNMAFINEMRKHIGAGVKFTMDPTTFIVSIDVLNIEGTVIYHTELDLPLEEFVVDADYDDGKLTITLKSGKIVEIPVANIVNGLVTEAKHDADIKALNDRMDAQFNAYIVDVYNLVGGDYVDYSG